MESPVSRAFFHHCLHKRCFAPGFRRRGLRKEFCSVRDVSSITISVTDRWPEVMVSDLSSTIVSIECRFSRLSADLIRDSLLGGFPGTHHDGDRRCQPPALRTRNDQHGNGVGKRQIQSSAPRLAITITVTMAIPMTTGTKMPLNGPQGARSSPEFPASSTSRMICASVVSSPTLDAWNRNVPFLLIVVPK